MTQAIDIMRAANPNALAAEEGDLCVFIEDVTDSDGRMFRMEYNSTPDGRHAVAFCRFNPWSPAGPPNAGADYHAAHVAEDGFICLGSGHDRRVEHSPFTLQTAIERCHYWPTAFSYFKENGTFPQP